MRFISPKTDFAFKKIFGSNDSKDILISFLNAILYNGESRIQDLEIIDPDAAGTTVGLKDTYLDVKAKLDTQEIVIIEMQVLNVAAFEKRVIYNAAKTYSTQLQSGEGYFKLKPVIALTLTDFIMFDRHDRFISRYQFKDLEDLQNYPHYELELVFVELPKFHKRLEDLEQLVDKWIYFIQNAPTLELIPPVMQSVVELNKAMNIANRSNLSLQELEDLEKREMFIQDQRGAVQRGLEEGRQEGRQEGQRELITRLLNRRFGELSQALQSQIDRLSNQQLEILSDAIFELNSVQDLEELLKEN
jgi:predicted transposase/invertase (TIGR01784 family)